MTEHQPTGASVEQPSAVPAVEPREKEEQSSAAKPSAKSSGFTFNVNAPSFAVPVVTTGSVPGRGSQQQAYMNASGPPLSVVVGGVSTQGRRKNSPGKKSHTTSSTIGGDGIDAADQPRFGGSSQRLGMGKDGDQTGNKGGDQKNDKRSTPEYTARRAVHDAWLKLESKVSNKCALDEAYFAALNYLQETNQLAVSSTMQLPHGKQLTGTLQPAVPPPSGDGTTASPTSDDGGSSAADKATSPLPPNGQVGQFWNAFDVRDVHCAQHIVTGCNVANCNCRLNSRYTQWQQRFAKMTAEAGEVAAAAVVAVDGKAVPREDTTYEGLSGHDLTQSKLEKMPPVQRLQLSMLAKDQPHFFEVLKLAASPSKHGNLSSDELRAAVGYSLVVFYFYVRLNFSNTEVRLTERLMVVRECLLRMSEGKCLIRAALPFILLSAIHADYLDKVIVYAAENKMPPAVLSALKVKRNFSRKYSTMVMHFLLLPPRESLSSVTTRRARDVFDPTEPAIVATMGDILLALPRMPRIPESRPSATWQVISHRQAQTICPLGPLAKTASDIKASDTAATKATTTTTTGATDAAGGLDDVSARTAVAGNTQAPTGPTPQHQLFLGALVNFASFSAVASPEVVGQYLQQLSATIASGEALEAGRLLDNPVLATLGAGYPLVHAAFAALVGAVSVKGVHWDRAVSETELLRRALSSPGAVLGTGQPSLGNPSIGATQKLAHTDVARLAGTLSAANPADQAALLASVVQQQQQMANDQPPQLASLLKNLNNVQSSAGQHRQAVPSSLQPAPSVVVGTSAQIPMEGIRINVSNEDLHKMGAADDTEEARNRRGGDHRRSDGMSRDYLDNDGGHRKARRGHRGGERERQRKERGTFQRDGP